MRAAVQARREAVLSLWGPWHTLQGAALCCCALGSDVTAKERSCDS